MHATLITLLLSGSTNSRQYLLFFYRIITLILDRILLCYISIYNMVMQETGNVSLLDYYDNKITPKLGFY